MLDDERLCTDDRLVRAERTNPGEFVRNLASWCAVMLISLPFAEAKRQFVAGGTETTHVDHSKKTERVRRRFFVKRAILRILNVLTMA